MRRALGLCLLLLGRPAPADSVKGAVAEPASPPAPDGRRPEPSQGPPDKGVASKAERKAGAGSVREHVTDDPRGDRPAQQALPGDPKGRPWLGLSIEKGAAGVRVREVMADSPCAATDLRPGDEVLALAETATTTPTQLITAVQRAGLGAKVTLKVRGTDGQERKVQVSLGPRPSMAEWQRAGLLGKSAPDFQPRVVSGPAMTTLGELRGEVVVLDFFASWCGPCMAALPDLAALSRRHRAEGLRVIGVSAEAEDIVARVARERRLPYTVVMDAGEQASRAYRIHAFPTLFVVDRRGTIRAVTNDVEEAASAAMTALAEGGGRGRAPR